MLTVHSSYSAFEGIMDSNRKVVDVLYAILHSKSALSLSQQKILIECAEKLEPIAEDLDRQDTTQELRQESFAIYSLRLCLLEGRTPENSDMRKAGMSQESFDHHKARLDALPTSREKVDHLNDYVYGEGVCDYETYGVVDTKMRHRKVALAQA